MARPRVRAIEGLELDLLYAVNPLHRRTWPNFQAPPPVAPHPPTEDELTRIGATEPEIVRADMLRAYPVGGPADAQRSPRGRDGAREASAPISA